MKKDRTAVKKGGERTKLRKVKDMRKEKKERTSPVTLFQKPPGRHASLGEVCD